MEEIVKAAKKFLKSDENSFSAEFSDFDGQKTLNFSIELTGSEFSIAVEDLKGKFKIVTDDEDLNEWQKRVNKYCKEGMKTITDVLTKSSTIFLELEDLEEDDLNDEEENEESSGKNEDEAELKGMLQKQRNLEENDENEEENEENEELNEIGSTDLLKEQLKEQKAQQDKEKDEKNKGDALLIDPEFEKEMYNKFGLSTSNSNFNQYSVNRLMKDYIAMCMTDTSVFGYKAEPRGGDIFKWDVKFFGFNPEEAEEQDIANDLRQQKELNGQDYFLFEMLFPKDYPFKPPFIRALKPRFQFRTGHVTVGGSVCNEILTSSGWTPGNSIETILISIRTGLIEGKARIDFNNTMDYSIPEAIEAFFRFATKYNWEKDTGALNWVSNQQ